MNGVIRSNKKSKDTLTQMKENTMTYSLRDTAKLVLGGKFIAIQAHLKKQEKPQINNLTLYLEELEKEQQANPKVSTRKKIIHSRVKINEQKITND